MTGNTSSSSAGQGAVNKWEAAHMSAPPARPSRSPCALTTPPRLHAYILDYMRKSGMTSSADAFAREVAIPSETEAALIDAPQGFLYEWWAVFWDVLSARTRKPASDHARLYVEVRTTSPSPSPRAAAETALPHAAARRPPWTGDSSAPSHPPSAPA